MSLSAADKAEVISSIQKELGLKDSDTGTVEVQVALLTKRIVELTEHFKVHNKDDHGRRGLKQLVNKRRKLLNYLKSEAVDRYRKVIQLLNLRH